MAAACESTLVISPPRKENAVQYNTVQNTLTLQAFASKPTLDFGEVKLGVRVEVGLRIFNPSDHDVEITIVNSPSPFKAVTKFTAPKSSGLLYNVAWRPREEGIVRKVLDVKVVPSRPPIRTGIILVGKCVDPSKGPEWKRAVLRASQRQKPAFKKPFVKNSDKLSKENVSCSTPSNDEQTFITKKRGVLTEHQETPPPSVEPCEINNETFLVETPGRRETYIVPDELPDLNEAAPTTKPVNKFRFPQYMYKKRKSSTPVTSPKNRTESVIPARNQGPSSTRSPARKFAEHLSLRIGAQAGKNVPNQKSFVAAKAFHPAEVKNTENVESQTVSPRTMVENVKRRIQEMVQEMSARPCVVPDKPADVVEEVADEFEAVSLKDVPHKDHVGDDLDVSMPSSIFNPELPIEAEAMKRISLEHISEEESFQDADKENEAPTLGTPPGFFAKINRNMRLMFTPSPKCVKEEFQQPKEEPLSTTETELADNQTLAAEPQIERNRARENLPKVVLISRREIAALRIQAWYFRHRSHRICSNPNDMADDKDKKIKVRFCETFSRSLGQTQDFYDDNVGDDDGLSPPWRKDVALTIEKAPEQAEMETWATNRGRGLANRTALRPIPSVGQRHLPAETSNRITRPWRSATCNERHIDASNGLQSRVITTLSSTRLEGHWEPTKPSDEDLLTEFPREIHTLSDLMRVVAYETAEDLRNALTEAGAATYGIYGVPLPDFDAMREKVWCEMKKITYELMILKKILNEAVEDTGKAKKEADEAYEKFQPGLVSKLQKTCAEFGRIHGCRDKLRRVLNLAASFLLRES
ncbi:unnamed protein product [Notodromas monacha]|uniref:Abnormal spindle-like microcephaly-associated protein ASH domain-containing protein n=1 Tax=Notodromas monacha TaxID=399045 RepID=A0A7R9BPC5_9CRUS|nr:unnamed protein product [Notodromas monacha]CAG0918122.1 unnamed protein product [Notodromas monacha]